MATPEDPAVFVPDRGIYAEYFRLSSLYVDKCGPNTVLLMQVGAFFEIYATKTPQGLITRTRIEDVSHICGGLSIAEKKYMHGADMIVMAGFRDYNLDKYIQLIVDADFTVVVYAQKELAGGGEFTREHAGTYSPGTFMPMDADVSPKMTNNVVSVWLETYTPLLKKTTKTVGAGAANKPHVVVGASVVNIFTGASTLFEFETAFDMVPAAFDPLEKFISTHSPSETILVSPFDEPTNQRILQYSGVQSRVVHTLPSTAASASASAAGAVPLAIANSSKPQYIRRMLASFFQEDTYDLCEEFQRYAVATQSYVYLLHFVQERSPNLVRKITLPRFDNQGTAVTLANHTLRQLNILDDAGASVGGAAAGQLRSVVSFLNKCCSAGGKRRFYNQMVHPTFDVDWLQREYAATALLLSKYDMVGAFRKLIAEVVDLEKIVRQLVLRKLYPDAVARLFRSAMSIQQMHICLLEDEALLRYFMEDDAVACPHAVVAEWIRAVLDFVTSQLQVDQCVGLTSMTNFDGKTILQPGVNEELDALLARKEENDALFQEIRECFNGLMCSIENKKTGDYVKVHDTEKSGSFLQLTKKRSNALKAYFADQTKRDPQFQLVLQHRLPGAAPEQTQRIAIAVSTVRMTTASSSNDNIEFPLLDRIVRERLTLRDTLNQRIAQAYADFLDRMETELYTTLERLAAWVARIDVLQSKAYVAHTYRYCRPRIEDRGASAFVRAKQLRHCLIEHLQTNELFVPNDVEIAGDAALKLPAGILLYGTNAVGKTSLIRAVGIAVVLAQTGMYVPCAEFVYSPYRAIFTRILGNDNLFKGLSMFAVEMSELRVILNAADAHSLVLGDELCSGTETESALSIFMSGLMSLHEKRASFLFATHFHEILKFEEMQRLTARIAVKHMAVRYDREADCLVYDRLLRDGAGNRLYGLEVAKSLHLPADFIETAYQIRNHYFPEMQGELAASVSRYNAQKVRSFCEVCKTEMATETHHLIEQRKAGADGFIEGTAIHKNHAANLAALCESCHQKMHHPAAQQAVPHLPGSSSSESVIRKKTTRGYKLVPESLPVTK
jgi:DNA mismatch repair protein MutS